VKNVTTLDIPHLYKLVASKFTQKEAPPFPARLREFGESALTSTKPSDASEPCCLR
jgi:hypothetical protein